MKEIRLCVERRRRGGRSSLPCRSVWVQDTPDAREELSNIAAAGNVKWGERTHWVEERDRPFGRLTRMQDGQTSA